MAEGGTGKGHRITVARSKTLMGVYESCPYNPILRQWDENGRLQCCGHGMPVETPEGDWYMVYLCNRSETARYALLGRETSMDPITWTADGWPIVNSLRGPSDLQKKPFPGKDWIPTESEEYFSPEEGFWGEWSTIRGFEPGTFVGEGGEILIQGNGRDLNTSDYTSLLLKHQKDFAFEMSCRVKVEETVAEASGDWDAGLTCYYDENSYLKLALANRCGKYGILAAEYVDDRYVSEEFLPLTEEAVRLAAECVNFKIVTEDLKRSLYYRLAGEEWIPAAVFEKTSYLSSEGLKKGKRFTGAAAGIYVNGTVKGRFINFKM